MMTSADTDRPTVAAWHDRMLGAGMARRQIAMRSGHRVHLVEAGSGPPVLHLHGTNTCCLSHVPLLERLDRVRSVAVDRPGHGLSERGPAADSDLRTHAVRFVDEVLDRLGLPSAALAGGSMGGTWATWYALSRPERVDRLVLLGSAPALPGTRPPWLLRTATTPVVGDLLSRHVPPSRDLVVRLMTAMGEGGTIVRHPDLLDSLVASGHDRAVARTNLAELRSVLSWLGFRRSIRISPEELRRLAVPTLMVWGDHDPVASTAVAQRVADLVPGGRLEVLPAGHVPWLGHPDLVARLLSDFVLADP